MFYNCEILSEKTTALFFHVGGAVSTVGIILFLIEGISFSIRFISLGLRLFANILSGTIIEELIEAAAWSVIITPPRLNIVSAPLLFGFYNEVLSMPELIATFV